MHNLKLFSSLSSSRNSYEEKRVIIIIDLKRLEELIRYLLLYLISYTYTNFKKSNKIFILYDDVSLKLAHLYKPAAFSFLPHFRLCIELFLSRSIELILN